MYKYIFIISMLGILVACGLTNTNSFLTKKQIEYKNISPESNSLAQKNYGGACNDHLNYTPDEQHPEFYNTKLVRVNFHIIRKSDGTGNFDEKRGVPYVKGWLDASNSHVRRNSKMNLPVDNNTPVLPINYRYVLAADPNIPGDDGIYFHNDDELYYYVKNGKNRNISDKRAFEKYGVQKGKVLNVIMQAHHPDSVASPSYNPTKTGIAFVRDGYIKVAGNYYLIQDTLVQNGKPFIRSGWFCHDIMNHEIGHVLGLRHSWRGNDGCDDTPHHKNCYSQNRKRATCWDEWSNNVMDYNTHQNSWTPCQIGIIQRNFAKEGSVPRNLIVPTWCRLDQTKNIYIKDHITWKGAKDLEGNLIIENGGSLTVQCRISIPKNGRVIVRPGATLTLDGAQLHNACGDQWQGIEVASQGRQEGKVVFINNPVIENSKNPIE